MGDLDLDSTIEGGGGHWQGTLSEDWAIWGPCGGYVATFLLRAAGAHSGLPRPASLSCHFLGVAEFAPVDLETVTLRGGRRSESVRVRMSQEGRPIAEALVWVVDETEGLAYDWTVRPDVPPPRALPTVADLMPEGDPPFRFWDNLVWTPIDWVPFDEWAATGPHAPENQAWYRFQPTPAFTDRYVEAARVTIVADILGWPTAHRAVPPEEDRRWMAPNLDVAVAFHQDPAGSEYLLVDATAPLATGGLIGASGRVWSEDGRLLATTQQQMLSRPVPPP
jgi:acyl-CoA thioesterase II